MIQIRFETKRYSLLGRSQPRIHKLNFTRLTTCSVTEPFFEFSMPCANMAITIHYLWVICKNSATMYAMLPILHLHSNFHSQYAHDIANCNGKWERNRSVMPTHDTRRLWLPMFLRGGYASLARKYSSPAPKRPLPCLMGSVCVTRIRSVSYQRTIPPSLPK